MAPCTVGNACGQSLKEDMAVRVDARQRQVLHVVTKPLFVNVSVIQELTCLGRNIQTSIRSTVRTENKR
jgi:hypothetical protein